MRLDEQIEEALFRIRSDALVAALPVYERDLRAVLARLTPAKVEWERYGHDCALLLEERGRHDQALFRFRQAGCEGHVPETLLAFCSAEQAALNSWGHDLSRRMVEVTLPALGRIGATLRQLAVDGQRSLDHVAAALDPANTELVFRIFAEHKRAAVQRGQSTACEALAALADALATRVRGGGELLAIMERTVATESNPAFLGEERVPQQVDFYGLVSGFRPEFVISEQDNQVRHTTFYLNTGRRFTGPGAQLASYIFDVLIPDPPQRPDFELAVAAAKIGWKAANRYLGASQVGSEIRRRICR